MPRHLSPFSDFLGPSTEEQRSLALQSTRETLTKLRDVLRELDLPADKLDLAAEIYSVQLGGLMHTEMEKKQRERAKRLRAKYEAGAMQRAPGDPMPRFGIPGFGVPGFGIPGYVGGVPPFDPADFDDEG